MPLPLTSQEAHLWYASVDELRDPVRTAACEALLTADERVAWQRFVTEHSRQEYLLTRALCRTVLSQYCAVSPVQWSFVRNPYGRPEISGPALPMRLRFSLSNTRGFAACLVVLEIDAGVDAEMCKRRANFLHLVDSVFSPAERAALVALPAHLHAERFFSVWTLKEAYIKARGLGLSLGLQQFGVQVTPVLALQLPATWPPPPPHWQLGLFVPEPDLMLAVALCRGDRADLQITLHRGLPLG